MTTYNTGNPIGSTDPRDLYDNAQNFDFALNSLTEAIWLDRFGVGRRTWYGLEVMVADAAASYGIITLSGVSFTTGATVNLNEALLNTANNTYYKWTGSFPAGGKIVPPSSTPESTGGIGPGKWLSVGDTVLRSDLASTEVGKGAELVTDTTSGRTVQHELDTLKGRVTVNLSDYPDLLAACEALRPSNGGRVIVDIGNFFSGETNGINKYMDIDNVSIVGTKMPTWNSDASALVGGSIMEGKFNVGAHNFSISNIGFDVGLNVVNKRWPDADTTADYPYGGTWDGFAIGQPSQSSPLPQWRGFKAQNVIGLLKDSATVGHGVLIENVNTGGLAGDIVGIYGTHGVVIKSENIAGGNLYGYMNSVDGVIFKSDTYARGGNVQHNNIVYERYLPNCTPHSIPQISEYGVYFNPETDNFTGPVQLSNVRVRDAKYGVHGASVSGSVGADIQISNVDIDGLNSSGGEWGIFFANFGIFPRLSFGNVNIKNMKNGVYSNYIDSTSSGNAQTTIATLKLTAIDSIGILTAGNSKASIGTVDMFGVQTAYYQENESTLKIGTESLVGVTTKWGNSPYIVGPGWSNLAGGNSTLDVVYSGYEVKLKGLLQASTGVTDKILTLPAYLRPMQSLRFIAYKNTGGTRGMCLIGVSSSGIVSIDDGTAPAVGSYISLDGISWKLKGEVP